MIPVHVAQQVNSTDELSNVMRVSHYFKLYTTSSSNQVLFVHSLHSGRQLSGETIGLDEGINVGPSRQMVLKYGHK